MFVSTTRATFNISLTSYLANHRSFADYAVLGHIAEKEDMHGRYNFFAWKRTFRLPDWRAGLKSMQLSQNWSLSEAEIYEVFSEAVNSKKPFWVFIFPEVNIISSLKIDQVSPFPFPRSLLIIF